MAKKQYKRPKTKMLTLQHQQALLTMSGEISGYSSSSGSGFSQDDTDTDSGAKSQGNTVIWDE